MKEKVFSLFLMAVDFALFFLLGTLLKIPTLVTFKLCVLWVIVLLSLNGYKIESTLIWEQLKKVGRGTIYFCIAALLFVYPLYKTLLKVWFIAFIVAVISILLNRSARVLFRSFLARRTLVIGVGPDAFRVGQIANSNRFALTELVGYVSLDDDLSDEEENPYEKGNVKLYRYSELEDILRNEHIDQVIIAIPEASQEMIDEVSKKIFDRVKYINIVPNLNFTITFNSQVSDFDGVLLISTSKGELSLVDKICKRTIDICAGIVGCLLLIPLSFYVKAKNKKNGDNEPIVFVQERIGLYGKPIKIYKYRSMVPNAEQILEELMEKDPAIKEEYLTNKKLVNDPRVTEAGKFLRRTSLDEFPQFINVLKGEMSLVGPRPYLPRERQDMDFYYDSIIRCKPGITGMWQANGRSDVGFRDRCKLDDYYYRNWSLTLDIIIIYKTIKSVLYGKGAI